MAISVLLSDLEDGKQESTIAVEIPYRGEVALSYNEESIGRWRSHSGQLYVMDLYHQSTNSLSTLEIVLSTCTMPLYLTLVLT